MPRQAPRARNRRRRDPHAAAYPGRFAKEHKRRWLQLQRAVAEVRIRPAARNMLDVLVDRAGQMPQFRQYTLGLGGVRDAAHRRWLEERKAAGLPPPRDGLAELTGMSRSSMIRATRDLVAGEWIQVARGGGRLEGGEGRANAISLGGAFQLPSQADQEAQQAEQQAAAEPEAVDYERARQKLREATERGLSRDARGP